MKDFFLLAFGCLLLGVLSDIGKELQHLRVVQDTARLERCECGERP